MKKQTVLITGASGGLGLALCRQFAQNGYDLILTARSEQRLKEIAAQLEAAYTVSVFTVPADLALPESPETILTAVQKAGKTVDILVNNAGFGDFGLFAECDLQKQEAMLDVNIRALMRLTRLILPSMRERKSGKILNVASIAGFEPGPFMSVYYATKAFVLSFSQALSRELKLDGITVTALCPGPIKTGFEDAADLHGSKLFQSLPVADADHVAKYGYRSLMKGKTVAIHGVHCKLLVFAVRLTPRRLVTAVISKIQGRR